MFVVRERLKHASELKSVSCGITFQIRRYKWSEWTESRRQCNLHAPVTYYSASAVAVSASSCINRFISRRARVGRPLSVCLGSPTGLPVCLWCV